MDNCEIVCWCIPSLIQSHLSSSCWTYYLSQFCVAKMHTRRPQTWKEEWDLLPSGIYEIITVRGVGQMSRNSKLVSKRFRKINHSCMTMTFSWGLSRVGRPLLFRFVDDVSDDLASLLTFGELNLWKCKKRRAMTIIKQRRSKDATTSIHHAVH